MIDADKQKFRELMMIAGEVYNREISKELLKAYFTTMTSLPIQQVSDAMMAHLQDPDSGQFFPKPADLVRHVIGTSKKRAAEVEDRAAIAWACVEREIRRIGSYGTLALEDKQALAAIKAMGGWKDLCSTELDKMEWRRKEFIRIYETYDRTPIDQLPANLPGRIELSEHKQQQQGRMQSLSDGVAAFRAKGQLKISHDIGDK